MVDYAALRPQKVQRSLFDMCMAAYSIDWRISQQANIQDTCNALVNGYYLGVDSSDEKQIRESSKHYKRDMSGVYE